MATRGIGVGAGLSQVNVLRLGLTSHTMALATGTTSPSEAEIANTEYEQLGSGADDYMKSCFFILASFKSHSFLSFVVLYFCQTFGLDG